MAMAKAAAEAAAMAAAAAMEAATQAAEAAAAVAASSGSPHGDASQRIPGASQPQPPSPAAAGADTVKCHVIDATGRQLFGKELEAQLRAAAPETYED